MLFFSGSKWLPTTEEELSGSKRLGENTSKLFRVLNSRQMGIDSFSQYSIRFDIDIRESVRLERSCHKTLNRVDHTLTRFSSCRGSFIQGVQSPGDGGAIMVILCGFSSITHLKTSLNAPISKDVEISSFTWENPSWKLGRTFSCRFWEIGLCLSYVTWLEMHMARSAKWKLTHDLKKWHAHVRGRLLLAGHRTSADRRLIDSLAARFASLTMEGRILDRQLLETEDGGEEPGRASGRNATLGTGCFSPLSSILPVSLSSPRRCRWSCEPCYYFYFKKKAKGNSYSSKRMTANESQRNSEGKKRFEKKRTTNEKKNKGVRDTKKSCHRPDSDRQSPVYIFVLRKKGSKTKERMKEKEIEKGDCGRLSG